uniref:RRM domain-containing protein n=1 Tax=Scophthalmus maximus TaxID=52904 RepID=A0A8D3DAE1_SCOMX
MAQPFPPAQYPTPPQNGIPAEYATAHTHQPADYTGPSTVTEHALTLYTPTHSHSEQPGNDSNTTALPANRVTAEEVVQTEGSQQLHLEPIDLSGKQQPKRLHVSNIPFRFRDPDLRQMFGVRQVVHEEVKDLQVIHDEGCLPWTRATRPVDPCQHWVLSGVPPPTTQELEKQVSRGPGESALIL